MAKDKINWSPIGGQAPTGEESEIDADKPAVTERISEETISSAAKSGQKARNVNYWDRAKETGQSAINPLAMALLGAVRSLPTLSKVEGYSNPLIPLIVGSGAGLQARQDMGGEERARQIAELGNEKMENRFPDFIAQNPWAKGMSVNDFKAMGPTLASLQKRSDYVNILDEGDLPVIAESLKTKGYSPEEAVAISKTLIGQPFSFLKEMKSKQDLSGGDVQPTVETLPNGLQVIKTKTRTGYRYSVIPGQILTDTERSRIPLANEALREAEVIKDVLSKPGAQEIILKAGGDYGKLASFGDPDSQRVYRAVQKMADARMRVLTGAAANQSEVRMYFDNFFNRLYGPETILQNIEQEKIFFNDYLGTLKTGKVMPGGGQKAPPAEKPNKNEISAWD